MDLPTQGMTTDRWKAIEPTPVALHDLRFTQQGVYVAALLDVHYGRHEPHTGGCEHSDDAFAPANDANTPTPPTAAPGQTDSKPDGRQ